MERAGWSKDQLVPQELVLSPMPSSISLRNFPSWDTVCSARGCRRSCSLAGGDMSGKLPGTALSNEQQANKSAKCPLAAAGAVSRSQLISYICCVLQQPQLLLCFPLPTSYTSMGLWLGFGNPSGRIFVLVCSGVVSQEYSATNNDLLPCPDSTCGWQAARQHITWSSSHYHSLFL